MDFILNEIGLNDAETQRGQGSFGGRVKAKLNKEKFQKRLEGYPFLFNFGEIDYGISGDFITAKTLLDISEARSLESLFSLPFLLFCFSNVEIFKKV